MDIDILKNKLILMVFPILAFITLPIILFCLESVKMNTNNILIIVGCGLSAVDLVFVWIRQLCLLKFYTYRNTKKMNKLIKMLPINLFSIIFYFAMLIIAGSLITSSLINSWLGNSTDMWFLFVVISLSFVAGLYLSFSGLFNLIQDIHKNCPFFVKYIGNEYLEHEKVYIVKFVLIPQIDSDIAIKKLMLKHPNDVTLNDYDRIKGFYKNGVIHCLLDDVSKLNTDEKYLLSGRITAVDGGDKVALLNKSDLSTVKEKLNRGTVEKKIAYD